jgi:chemotaxis protein CheX
MGAAKLNDQNALLSPEVINAFIDGVKKTIETFTSYNVSCGKPSIQKKIEGKADVSAILGMTSGQVKGSLILSFPKKTLFCILDKMLSATHTELNDEASDAVGELTNVVYGTAKNILNSKGWNFEMSIPTVIQGDFVVKQKTNITYLNIPFNVNGHEFNVDLSID